MPSQSSDIFVDEDGAADGGRFESVEGRLRNDGLGEVGSPWKVSLLFSSESTPSSSFRVL